MIVKEIVDKFAWEKFISLFSPSSLFQSWNWGEAIKKISRNSGIHDAVIPSKSGIASGQNLWRLGLFDQSKLVGIALIQKVVARRGTFLHIRHGPILSKWSNKYFEYFLEQIKALALEQKALFIRISPLLGENLLSPFFFAKYKFNDSPVHQLDGEICWVIDLNNTNDEILSKMRKSTRYLIRNAQKFGIVIKSSKSPEDLPEFLKLYNLTAKRQHFVKHRGIFEEFESFLKDDQILLFKGYHNNQLLSAALIIFYNHQAIYHHSASIESKYPVNYLLQWEVIQEAKRRGKSLYNLWGVTKDEKNKRHPWQGLSLFKRGFGGHLVESIHTKDYPLSYRYCATYVWETLRKIWKGY